MKLPWSYMTVGDWLVITVLIVFAVAGMAWVAGAPVGSRLVVSDGDRICFTATLDQHRTVELEGPLGRTRLVIDNQGARITGSPCPRKSCMTMGPARQTGDLLACVPNRILVRIDGERKKDSPYDLLSR